MLTVLSLTSAAVFAASPACEAKKEEAKQAQKDADEAWAQYSACVTQYPIGSSFICAGAATFAQNLQIKADELSAEAMAC